MDPRYLIAREAAASRMLADHLLVRSTVDAIELVVGDVAVHPLNLRPELSEHIAGSLGGHLDVFWGKPAYSRHLTLDYKLGHVRLSTSLSCEAGHTSSAVRAIATEQCVSRALAAAAPTPPTGRCG